MGKQEESSHTRETWKVAIETGILGLYGNRQGPEKTLTPEILKGCLVPAFGHLSLTAEISRVTILFTVYSSFTFSLFCSPPSQYSLLLPPLLPSSPSSASLSLSLLFACATLLFSSSPVLPASSPLFLVSQHIW